MYETLEYASEDGIGVVRLNRPTKLNAIGPATVRELRAVADAVREDAKTRVLVFTGAGRAFSAGADIAELVKMASPPAFLRFIEDIQTTYNAIEDLPIPTVAAVNGLAYGGGCELALACDFRLMAEDATLGVPEILIGALPGAGGTQRLSHMLPPAIAKQMIYFGEPMSADRALQYGLANAVVPSGQAMEVAMEWARRLSRLPPLALRSAKILVHTGMNTDLKTGIEAERHTLAYLFGTEDRREGMHAFLEKRPAVFTGR
jgi:enoyl-CoA hydratase